MFRIRRTFLQMLHLSEKYTNVKPNTYIGIRLLSSREFGAIESVTSHDILLQNLKEATSTKSVLKLISAHRLIMNNKHLLQAFKTLFYLQKSQRTKMPPREILEHPDFKALCLSLKYKARTMDINDLIESFKILSYIGAPSDSTIMQIILQIIRHDINNLTQQQIIFLTFLLRHVKSTPLSDALLIALPIIFDIQLPTKIDKDNLPSLADSLQFSAKNKISNENVDCIIDALMGHKTYSTKIAISIAWSLCDMNPRPIFYNLLEKCFSIICDSREEISVPDLETTLTKLVSRYSLNHPCYYQKQFFDLVSDKIVEKNVDFQQVLWILQKFLKAGYSNKNLLEYLSNLCQGNINLITKTSLWNISVIVGAYANTDFRPTHWEYVRQGILENKNVYDTNNDINWIKFGMRLALLDIFIPKILEKCFQEDYVKKMLQEDNPIICQHLLILYQTIMTQHPEFENVLTDSTIIDKTSKYILHANTENSPLQTALEKGLGGKSYVLTNVLTKLGHLLHHVVIMRRGGYPVAFNSTDYKPIVLEELQYPRDCQVIAIFGFGPVYYQRDSYILKPLYSLMIRTIEANEYSTLVIPLEVWLSLPDYEKIPYLMRSIRTKNEEYEKIPALQ